MAMTLARSGYFLLIFGAKLYLVLKQSPKIRRNAIYETGPKDDPLLINKNGS